MLPSSGPDEKLLQDLKKIAEIIKRNTNPTEEHSLALVRIVRGMSLSQWASSTSFEEMHDWIGVPLSNDEALSMEKFSDVLEQLIFQRDHDALTGVYNRLVFDRRLLMEIERATRTSTDVSLVLLDIDDFKVINDTHGHQGGDQVLSHLGSLLRGMARTYDTVSRIGGEEFAVILPATASIAAKIFANRLLLAFSESLIAIKDIKVKVTFSAGISSLKTISPPTTPGGLMESADKALYTAKRTGKNRIMCAGDANPLSLVLSAEKQFLFSGNEPNKEHL